MQTLTLPLDTHFTIGQAYKSISSPTLKGKAVYTIARNLAKLQVILSEFNKRHDNKLRETTGGAEKLEATDPKFADFAKWKAEELKVEVELGLFILNLEESSLSGLDPTALALLLQHNLLVVLDDPAPTPCVLPP